MKVSWNEICSIGASITHLYQPICNITNNTVIGHEALLRDAVRQRSPADIFLCAEAQGIRDILDLISVRNAVTRYMEQVQLLRPLFVNVYPATLLEADFISQWERNIPGTVPIVLELLENEPIQDWTGLKEIIAELSRRGVKLAIDDLGNGYSFFQQWIELHPDYIKVDRYYARKLSECIQKQRVIKSLLNLFSGSTELILEGIETKDDLDMARFLGITLAQGFLLGVPGSVNSLD